MSKELDDARDAAAELLLGYRPLTGRRALTPIAGANLRRLKDLLQDLVNDYPIDTEVAQERNGRANGALQYGPNRSRYLNAAMDCDVWVDEANVMGPLHFTVKMLRRDKEQARKILSRCDPLAHHALGGTNPVSHLVTGLATDEISTIGIGQSRLSHKQRVRRKNLVEIDVAKLTATVYLLGNAAAIGTRSNVFPVSFALAVAQTAA